MRLLCCQSSRTLHIQEQVEVKQEINGEAKHGNETADSKSNLIKEEEMGEQYIEFLFTPLFISVYPLCTILLTNG